MSKARVVDKPLWNIKQTKAADAKEEQVEMSNKYGYASEGDMWYHVDGFADEGEIPILLGFVTGGGMRSGFVKMSVKDFLCFPVMVSGIDAMGPLPRTANGKLYILVAIDYMTRFGTPLEIVSDNGPGFRRGLLTEVCEELKISHRHSTPYYPQSNGLVEKANGLIAGIIRKMVESKPKRRDNFLYGAIWAYITTYRDAIQFTPFHLVYGQEALQPIELNIPTIKLTGRQEQNNDEAWIDRLLNLVELE
ncbi:hypothetical protein L7F22_017241 [Adiantum nelumboides]|nr:hypothetical protein [Adiantum nelumboides]